MMKPHLLILDGNNTICVVQPLLSLEKDTARLNPKLSTSPIARKTNLVGQTKSIIRRDLQRYQIMHIMKEIFPRGNKKVIIYFINS